MTEKQQENNFLNHSQKLGRLAEDLAANYILSLGWFVIARNLRNQYGEIDIIAVNQEKELIIIEVRARTIGKIMPPLDSIGPRKLRTLLNAAKKYADFIPQEGKYDALF